MDQQRLDRIVGAVIDQLNREGLLNGAGNGSGNGMPVAAQPGRATGLPPTQLSRIAVLGAGNGGMGIAAHQKLKGYWVSIFSSYEEELKPIREKGGIDVFGGATGFAKIDLITSSISEAIRDAEVIMIVAPALSHRTFASLLAPCLKDGQVVILNPGRVGGALEFSRALKRFSCRARIYLAEAQTLIYAAETRAPARVEILKEKNKMRVAALPASDNDVVIPLAKQMYPQIEAGQNVLELAFNNVGAVFHPAPMLLNTPTIERVQAGEPGLKYYGNMVTKSISDMVMEKVDVEKVAIANAFGLDAWTAKRWVWESYGIPGEGRSLFELLRANIHVAGFSAPPHLLSWHSIPDEVPNVLVPMISFAEAAGIKTPTMRALVDMACVMCDIDWWSEGRTVESLGLGGMTVPQMLEYVERGCVNRRCDECTLCNVAAN